jgi:hypothetical protein
VGCEAGPDRAGIPLPRRERNTDRRLVREPAEEWQAWGRYGSRWRKRPGRLDPSAIEMGEYAAGTGQQGAGSGQHATAPESHHRVSVVCSPLPPPPPPKQGSGQGARASNSEAARTTTAAPCGETGNPRASCATGHAASVMRHASRVMRRHQEKKRCSGIVPRTLALISMPAAGSRRLVENGAHRRQMPLRATFPHRPSPIAHCLSASAPCL